MKQLEAIIFDVDGTLADTEDVHRRAFNRAFKEFDLDWDWTPKLYEELLSISGGYERITHYGVNLAPSFRDPEEFSNFVRELHKAKSNIYAGMLTAGEVPLRIGVERLLHNIRDHGLTLAIATSSTYTNLKTLLDRNLPTEWPSWFAAVATCDTVSAKKPSPAVYEAVLGILEIDPISVMAIEDTVNGCVSATKAGVSTVITTHRFTRHHRFPHASLVVDSLGDVGHPFGLIYGDAGKRKVVDVALIDDLLTARPQLAPMRTTQRTATA